MKVPNTSTFSLQNVVDVVQPISPGTPKISLLYKSSTAQDVTVSCNGYFYIMYWQGNNSLTVSEFVITHHGLYGDLLLNDEGGGYFSFTGPQGASASGSCLWTDAGAHTYLTSTGDNVSIGKNTNSGKKLEVWGDCEASGTWVASNFVLPSLRKLKKQIQPIEKAEWADQIHLRQFVFRGDKSERLRFGVIIDEVEEIAPNLVYEGKTVSYIDLLIVKIARLEQKLKAIEDEQSSKQ